MRGERVPELWVAHDGGVSDAVERFYAVHDSDRVQPAPVPGREHASVDLKVEVAVGIAGAGGVVPHHRGLELLNRDLDLPTPGSDSSRCVLGEPLDDLDRRTVAEGLKQHGASDMMIPRKIVPVDKLPVLGSGKTDYVTLARFVHEAAET